MKKKIARLVISAPASGSGKTMVTCAILKAYARQGKRLAAFKCGPDYIDPMFHKKVLDIDSYNLDTFLCGENYISTCLLVHGADADLCLIEGAMGYYDGVGGISTQASAYDVARLTQTKTVLVVDCKGMSVSIVPYIQGFVHYKEDSQIGGVILNRLSPMLYERMKRMIETETGLKVYGYLPVMKDCEIESRHLGLHLPEEEERTQESLDKLAVQAEKTLDLEALYTFAQEASELEMEEEFPVSAKQKLRVAVAMDSAFCFMYKDNLKLLETYGAKIIPFSPISDTRLPEDICGLILYGGYPELHAEALSENRTMREAIRKAVQSGIPCIAECGGFMYLMEALIDAEGRTYEMAGFLKGKTFYTSSLKRFGYVTLSEGKVFGEAVGEIPAHEFHYYDAENCGDAFLARKPLSTRQWRCMVSTDTVFAGYPHMHYAGNEKVPEAFMKACRRWKKNERK